MAMPIETVHRQTCALKTCSNIIPCHAADPGNRENKWIDRNGQPRSCLSVIKPLEDYDNFEVGDVQPGSYLIEVDGDRYLIGRQAQSMGGSPVFNGNKCEKAELLILTGIEPNSGSDYADIQKLNICLPDSRNRENVNHLLALVGERTFKRNGRVIRYCIQKVNAVDETRGAFLMAHKEGIFKYPSGVNGVMTLGGHDGTAYLYQPSSSRPDYSSKVQMPGTIYIAEMITSALSTQFHFSPKPEIIMDAIASSNYTYVQDGREIDFTKHLVRAKQSYENEIKGRLKTKWANHRGTLGQILIVGGTAHLMRSLTQNPFYLIPCDPQFYDVKGLVS